MRKRFLATLIILFTSVVTLWGCGDPYKGMALSLTTSNIDLLLELSDDDLTYEYDAEEFSANITGGKSSVDKNIVLPTSKFVTFERVAYNNGSTKIKVTAKEAGSEDVVITSVEGNLSAKLHISVGVKVNSLSFNETSGIAIEEGGALDLSTNGGKYLSFYPLTTTQKNVRYEVVEEGVPMDYAYFEGGVLHAVEGATYPTANGRRQITVRATSIDNPELTTVVSIPVVTIVRNKTISINSANGGNIALSPNASGEYEVVLAPITIGGVPTSNEYASHRYLSIQMGDSNIDHRNYIVNFDLTDLSDTDINNTSSKVGIEYDQDSAESFGFNLTGITAGTVRKTIYIDHKDYVGTFTQKVTLVIRTINIPTAKGLAINGKNLEYYNSNPFVVFNNYSDVNSRFGGTPFELVDNGTLGQGNSYNAFFTYDAYGYPDNKIRLTTVTGDDVINSGANIANGTTLYIKHDYNNLSGVATALTITFKYTLCPQGGNAEDYQTYGVSFELPIILRIGVTEDEINALSSNYYINSTDRQYYNVLSINSNLDMNEQLADIEMDNDLVIFRNVDNRLQVMASNALASGQTRVTLHFANGLVSRQFVVTSYVPMLYDTDNQLQLTTDTGAVFGVGSIAKVDDNLTLVDDNQTYTLGDYQYATFSNLVVPTNSQISLDVMNLVNVDGWQSIVSNENVKANAEDVSYLDWADGKLSTFNKPTITLDAEGKYVPTTLTLTLTGYTPGADITERIEVTVSHEIKVWIFHKLTATAMANGPTTDLYEQSSVGAKHMDKSMIDLKIITTPYETNHQAFGLIDTDYFIQDSDRVIKEYVVQQGIVQVRLSDLFDFTNEGKLVLKANDDTFGQIERAGINKQVALRDILNGGLQCTLVATTTQFGKLLTTTSTLTLYCAVKTTDIFTTAVGDSGLYFEVRDTVVTPKQTTFNYTLYPNDATNREVEIILPADSKYTYTHEYTLAGGTITIAPKAGVSLANAPEERLRIVAVDSYVTNPNYADDNTQPEIIPTVFKEIIIRVGNGTKANPFQVRNVASLLNMRQDSGNYYYVLANDINLSAITLPSTGTQFNGHFSGKFTYTDSEGKVITNCYSLYGLNINRTLSGADDAYIGLFDQLGVSAVISDVRLADSNIVVTTEDYTGIANIGILAGCTLGTINNCQVTGNIEFDGTKANIGGMVGRVADLKEGGVTSTPYIKGRYVADAIVNNSDANVNVDISVNSSADVCVGAVAGYVLLTNTNISIINFGDLLAVSSISVLNGKQMHGIVGGVLGYAHNANVGDFSVETDASSDIVCGVSVITDASGDIVGGVIGHMEYGSIADTMVEFSHSSTLRNKLTATTSLGGLIGKTSSDTTNGINVARSYVRSFASSKLGDDYQGTLVLTGTNANAAVGGIIGNNNSPATIDQTYFDGCINSTNAGAKVGGLMGYHTKTTSIRDSYITGTISATKYSLFSGAESEPTQGLPTSNATNKYNYSGSLIGSGEFMSLTQTGTSIDYTEYTTSLGTNTKIAHCYAFVNGDTYSVVGNETTSVAYRVVASVTNQANVQLYKLGQADTNYYFAAIVRYTTRTIGTSGTMVETKELPVKTFTSADLDSTILGKLQELQLIDASNQGNVIVFSTTSYPNMLGVGEGAYSSDGTYNGTNATAANNQLLMMLNAINNPATPDTDLSTAFNRLGSIEGMTSSTSDSNETLAPVAFSDVYGGTQYYVFSSNHFAITTGYGEKLEGMTLKDSEGNVIASYNGTSLTYTDTFKWAVIPNINGGMPVPIVLDTTLANLGDLNVSDDGSILSLPDFYKAIYSTLPNINTTTIDYPVNELNSYNQYKSQPYIRLSSNELVLTYTEGASNTYTIATNTPSDDGYEVGTVIYLDITGEKLPPEYFVQLLTNNAISMTSSNERVLKVENNTTLVTCGVGSTTLNIFSVMDDSINATIHIDVIDGYTHFNMYRGNSTITAIDKVYIDQEVALLPALHNKLDGVHYPNNTSGGLIVQYVPTSAEALAKYTINGKMIDADNPKLIVPNMEALTFMGLSDGKSAVRITPFVYLYEYDPNYKYASDLVTEINGRKAISLNNLGATYAVNVLARARSINIEGETSATGTPLTTINVDIVVVTNTANEPLLTDIAINGKTFAKGIDFNELSSFDAPTGTTTSLLRKYILALSTNVTEETKTDESGITTYTYTYHLSITMDVDKYMASITDLSGYTNPLAEDIRYDFTFYPYSNKNIKATYAYTLRANALTKFDTSFYAGGETSATGEYYPAEVQTTKITPGRSGLLKITPQNIYNALNYIEITAVNNYHNLTLTQLAYGVDDDITEDSKTPYSPLDYPATTIDNGIRLWNISKVQGGSLVYDNTYYVQVAANASMPQGINVTLRITAYDTKGRELYSQDLVLTTEYLPTITATIEGEQSAVAALGTSTPMHFASQYVDGGVEYAIINQTTLYRPFDSDEDTVTESDIYIATADGTKVDTLYNGIDYYLYVAKDCPLGYINIKFMGMREVNGMLETTECYLTIHVVYARITGATINGAGIENGDQVLTIKTGSHTSLGINLGTNNGTIFKDNEKYVNYIKQLGNVLAGHEYNGIFNVDGDGIAFVKSIDTINGYYLVNSTTNSANQLQVNTKYTYFEFNQSTGITNVDHYYYVSALNIGVSSLSLSLNYYYDEYGLIQPVSDTPEARDEVMKEGYKVESIAIPFYLNIQDSSTEDHPLPVKTQEDLELMEPSRNYIMLNDIVLENWKPMALNVASLDGNSYRLILRSFDTDSLATTASVGVFSSTRAADTLQQATMLKNITLDLCEFGTNSNGVCDLRKAEELTFGWLVAENNGCLTNCKVVTSNNKNVEFKINTYQTNIDSKSYTALVGGTVGINAGTISNSMIGITQSGTIKCVYNNALADLNVYPFTLSAGQRLAGFAANNSGTISNCYAKGVGLINLTVKESGSLLAGFVGTNSGKIYGSYVEGTKISNFRATDDKTSILRSVGTTAGFVYSNTENGIIENAYSKMLLRVNSVNTGGFVYDNKGVIRYAFTTTINTTGNTEGGTSSWAHGPFVGNFALGEAYGTIERCYYLILNDEFGLGDDDAANLDVLATIDPATAISSAGAGTDTVVEKVLFNQETAFEGFSITSSNGDDVDDKYIWSVNSGAVNADELVGPTLIEANALTVSYRKLAGVEEVTDEDGNKQELHNYTWANGYNIGSKVNPIIVNSADRFAENIVTETKQYDVNGTHYYIFGGQQKSGNNDLYAPSYIRVVNDINFSEEALKKTYQIASMGKKELALKDVIFAGVINGNGMTFDGIRLTGESSTSTIENYGLFNQVGLSDEQLTYLGNIITQTPAIYNLHIDYQEISNTSAQKVGVLAGSVYNSSLRMLSISGPVDSTSVDTSIITGKNLVGGVAGLIAGKNTTISDIRVSNIRLRTDRYTLNVGNDDVNVNGYYDIYVNNKTLISSSATTMTLNDNGVITNLDSISYAGSVAGAVLTNNYSKDITIPGTDVVDIRNTDSRINALRSTEAGTVQNILVSGNIDINADHAGGVFGYVGYNSHITKTVFELQNIASNGAEKYQHIYGRNRAGAIAGEVVGSVLEQVEVRHDTNTQKDIDANINGNATSISNSTLFTVSNSVLHSVSLSIGGIAGYAEDSAIIDSYAKVNVTNTYAKVAGGLVGYGKNKVILGYVYTTGDVRAKEIIGGLVGYYTYDRNGYRLYLQQAFALNKWSNVSDILNNNNSAIKASTSGLNTLVMPEIGNQLAQYKNSDVITYDTYGDYITSHSTSGKPYVFIGSVLGKATLQPGTYKYVIDNVMPSIESIAITIDPEGKISSSKYIKCDGEDVVAGERHPETTSDITLLEHYGITKYVKNLFVTNSYGYFKVDALPKDKIIAIPLYNVNNDLQQQYYNYQSSVRKDSTVWYNEYNNNVFSTTYGVLDKHINDNTTQTMSYRSGSFALNNATLEAVYHSAGDQFGGTIPQSGHLSDRNIYKTDVMYRVDDKFDTYLTYPSIMGKQTYFEKITGYFYDSNDNLKASYNNEFSTNYGFTKYTVSTENSDNTTTYSAMPSSVWYKFTDPTIYFPVYNNGKYITFNVITSVGDFREALSTTSDGAHYLLQSDITLDLRSGNNVEYMTQFMGSMVPMKAPNEEKFSGRRTITINLASGKTATLLNTLRNATFTNIDFVFNVVDDANFGNSSGALGLLAHNAINTLFNNCTFTFNTASTALKLTNTAIDSSAITSFGYVLGSATGTTFNNTTLKVGESNIEASVTDNFYHGLLVGKMDNCNINVLNVNATTSAVTLTGNADTMASVGLVAGGMNNTNITSASVANKYINEDKQEVITQANLNVSTTSNFKSFNLGGVVGYVYGGSMDSINAELVYNVNGGTATVGTITLGNLAGYVQSSSLINIAINESATTSKVTNVTASNMYVGGYVGYLVETGISTTGDYIVNHNNIVILTSDNVRYGYLAVGGIIGEISSKKVLTTISGYYNVADINVQQPTTSIGADSNYYIGGIVGKTSLTSVNNVVQLGDITSSNDQYGYIGGIVGYYGTGKVGDISIKDVMTYNLINFHQVEGMGDATGIRVGGILGGFGLDTSFSISDSYSYANMQCINTGADNYCKSISHYDIICPSTSTPANADVTYIKDFMPVRGGSYNTGTGVDYKDRITSRIERTPTNSPHRVAIGLKKIRYTWHITTIPKLMSGSASTLTTPVGYDPVDSTTMNNLLAMCSRERAYAGSIFQPKTIQASNDNVAVIPTSIDDIVILSDSTTLTGDVTIGPTGMLIGKISTENGRQFIDSESKVPVVNSHVCLITNKGAISNLAIELPAHRTTSLIDTNYGTLYCVSIWGQISAHLSYAEGKFSAVADVNCGTISNVTASVTLTGTVSVPFSGLVYTNHGVIQDVTSTSGGIGQKQLAGSKNVVTGIVTRKVAGIVAEQKGNGANYTGIRHPGDPNNNVIYAGVATLLGSADGNARITILDSTTANIPNGANVVTYDELLNTYPYTNVTGGASSRYATVRYYNFGIPFLRTTPVIYTYAGHDDIGGSYTLYNTSTTESNFILVRSPYDIVLNNTTIHKSSYTVAGTAWIIKSTDRPIAIPDVELISNINYANITKEPEDKLVIRSVNILDGSKFSFGIADSSDSAKYYTLTQPLIQAVKYVQDINFCNFSVTSSNSNVALIGAISNRISNVNFTNISINTDRKGVKIANFGIIGYLGDNVNTATCDNVEVNGMHLKIDQSMAKYVGFIGHTKIAKIGEADGIKILNSTISYTNYTNVSHTSDEYCNVGYCVGYAYNNTTISNCTIDSQCSMEINNTSVLAGGILGSNVPIRTLNIEISNCTMNGSIKSDSSDVIVSGITSFIYYYSTNYKCDISNCYVGGTLSKDCSEMVLDLDANLMNPDTHSKYRSIYEISCLSYNSTYESCEFGGTIKYDNFASVIRHQERWYGVTYGDFVEVTSVTGDDSGINPRKLQVNCRLKQTDYYDEYMAATIYNSLYSTKLSDSSKITYVNDAKIVVSCPTGITNSVTAIKGDLKDNEKSREMYDASGWFGYVEGSKMAYLAVDLQLDIWKQITINLAGERKYIVDKSEDNLAQSITFAYHECDQGNTYLNYAQERIKSGLNYALANIMIRSYKRTPQNPLVWEKV